MAINGSDSDGQGDRVLEELEEDYFSPDFKEHIHKEELKWSQHKVVMPYFRWVFWSEKDHEIEPSLSQDNCADFNRNGCVILKVKDNIRQALQKLILSPDLDECLGQFWRATTTLEGRTKLTTRYQPFALGRSCSSLGRQRLGEYRMKMCREYNCFYADVESGEEQLGVPGRVFLYKSPEPSPYVRLYSTKEYPQRNLALTCQIHDSLALPVFDHSSQTCVGVLEMVSITFTASAWHNESFLRSMCDIFQELGLQCFHEYQACNEESTKKGKKVKGPSRALQELKTVLRSVCQIHELPLAMTWVPCSACNGLRRCKLWSKGVEFCLRRDIYFSQFLKVSKGSHLRTGLVAKGALSSPNMLYCSDITQLSLNEYPLVHYARECKLSGWFTICLQSIYTGNDIYVLEFFLSARSKDDNLLSTLSFILETIEEKFKTFRLASGKKLGELMCVEVIYFQNEQKVDYIKPIQATRNFSTLSDLPSVQSSASVANKRPRFQGADMVTIKEKYDLNYDMFSDSDSDPSFDQSSASVAKARPRFQDMVTIKAKYASTVMVLKLSLPCRLVELQQEVAKRLKLEAGTYHVVYKDEEDEFVLIACDEDLQVHVDASISQGNPSAVVLLKPKEPATNLNPTN